MIDKTGAAVVIVAIVSFFGVVAFGAWVESDKEPESVQCVRVGGEWVDTGQGCTRAYCRRVSK